MQDFYFSDSKLQSKLEQMVLNKAADCNVGDNPQNFAKLWQGVFSLESDAVKEKDNSNFVVSDVQPTHDESQLHSNKVLSLSTLTNLIQDQDVGPKSKTIRIQESLQDLEESIQDDNQNDQQLSENQRYL